MQPKELDSLKTVTFDSIIAEYKQKGAELGERWNPQISTIKDELFTYLQVSSADELRNKLESQNELPLGFYYPCQFADRQCQIGSDASAQNAHCIAFGFEATNPPPQVQEAIDHLVNDSDDRKEVEGIVWKAGGVKTNWHTNNTDHNGVWVDESASGDNLGYGLYSLHESIFGKIPSEVASKLSLLKLHLKLGFTPKSIINPINGEVLKIDISNAVSEMITNGDEDLGVIVSLER